MKQDNISIYEPTLVGLGTQVQIVTYEAARRLLEELSDLIDQLMHTYNSDGSMGYVF